MQFVDNSTVRFLFSIWPCNIETGYVDTTAYITLLCVYLNYMYRAYKCTYMHTHCDSYCTCRKPECELFDCWSVVTPGG